MTTTIQDKTPVPKSYYVACEVCGEYCELGFNAVLKHGKITCDRCGKVRRDYDGMPIYDERYVDKRKTNVDKDGSDD